MTISDGQLVRRAWRGDHAAFGELAERHRRALHGLARRLTRDPELASDLTQEALIRAYVRLGDLCDPERFGPWLLSIARSVCINWVNADAIRRALAERRPPVFEPLSRSAAEEFEAWETTRELRELVAHLPDPYRSATERHYMRGQRQREIAAEMRVPVGTVKSWLHCARRRMRGSVTDMSKQWFGQCEWPEERPPRMALHELAQATLRRYDLGDFEALGSVYEPHDSLAVGVQTTRGRYRLWRYHGYMTLELVELQHAMLQHLARKGVAVKRLVPATDGSTYQQIDGRPVALFEWFSGPAPDLRSARDVAQVAELHARWTLAMADFDPPIPNWRTLAAQWRPRKGWAWVLPTEDLPLVPQRMGFFAAVRDVEDPPPHHDRLLAQVRDTEARLARFADLADSFRLSALPRGMNHGVFLFGCTDWEPTVTDADDFMYEARIGDLGRLLFAIHDREMPEYETRDRVALALDVYREHVDLAPEEARALPIIAWGQFLSYDVFHILLYLCELSAPDRGEYLVAKSMKQWVAIRDTWERRFLGFSEALANR